MSFKVAFLRSGRVKSRGNTAFTVGTMVPLGLWFRVYVWVGAPCLLSVLPPKVMDGNVITAKRTAAVSAIATKVSWCRAAWGGGVLQAHVSTGEVGSYLGLLTNVAGTLHARHGCQ